MNNVQTRFNNSEPTCIATHTMATTITTSFATGILSFTKVIDISFRHRGRVVRVPNWPNSKYGGRGFEPRSDRKAGDVSQVDSSQ